MELSVMSKKNMSSSELFIKSVFQMMVVLFTIGVLYLTFNSFKTCTDPNCPIHHNNVIVRMLR